MSAPERAVPDGSAVRTTEPGHAHGGGHGWMMIVCCIPMLLIAVGLVATGAASPSFLLVAIGCTAMMALMMRAMTPPPDGRNEGDAHQNAHAAHESGPERRTCH